MCDSLSQKFLFFIKSPVFLLAVGACAVVSWALSPTLVMPPEQLGSSEMTWDSSGH